MLLMVGFFGEVAGMEGRLCKLTVEVTWDMIGWGLNVDH